VLCLLTDHAGSLWIGTEGGLAKFENGQFMTLTTTEGLANNERCLWAVVSPLTVDDVTRALRAAVPDFETHRSRGSIDIRMHDEWYLQNGRFDPHATATGWKPYLAQALSDGYRGVRGTGSTAWVGKDTWKSFAAYESEFDASIVGHPLKALCSYDRTKCGTLELLEAARSHPQAIALRDEGYEIIPTSHERRSAAPLDEVVPEDEWRRRERANILRALGLSKGRIYGHGGAAERLSLKPSTLQSRIRAFGIRPGEADGDN